MLQGGEEGPDLVWARVKASFPVGMAFPAAPREHGVDAGLSRLSKESLFIEAAEHPHRGLEEGIRAAAGVHFDHEDLIEVAVGHESLAARLVENHPLGVEVERDLGGHLVLLRVDDAQEVREPAAHH